MTPARLQPGGATLLWFGLFGAPVAWGLQHITGFGLTVAGCGEAGVGVALDAWTIAVSATAAVVAVAAGAAAVLTLRASRVSDDEPPRARVHFLAVIAVTITPLFIAMILMSGLGAVLLDPCRQG